MVLSDGRIVGEDGQVLEVGNTVDIKNATCANTIGAAELVTLSIDREEQQAFYYARVLEITTPRWTTYDAATFKISPPDYVPGTVQQRVYSSPVWYGPLEAAAGSDCRG